MSPYIKAERRPLLQAQCQGSYPQTAGELNYVLTDLILRYLSIKTDLNYAAYNEVMGVLTCIQQELYRKRVAPLEDKKCAKNGEVF